MATYNYSASGTPLPQISTLQSLLANCGNPGTSPFSSSLVQGDTMGLLTKSNKNALRADLVSNYGAGGNAILWGLALECSGLAVKVTSGQALSTSIVEISSITNSVLTANTSSWIWLTSGGVITTASTIIAPDSKSVFLGLALTTAASMSFDLSGVMYLNNNQFWRRTADTGGPSDSPNSNLRVFTKTLAGNYLWDGTAHSPISNTYLDIAGVKANTDITLSASESNTDVVRFSWTGWTSGHSVFVSSVPSGKQWSLVNATGQACTFSTSASGITIASAKIALVYFDGSKIQRVTPDA